MNNDLTPQKQLLRKYVRKMYKTHPLTLQSGQRLTFKCGWNCFLKNREIYLADLPISPEVAPYRIAKITLHDGVKQ